MLPSARRQLYPPISVHQRDRTPSAPPIHHPSDASDLHSGNLARHFRMRPRGKQQFVIFASVEGLRERGARMNRQKGCIDLCRYARLFAEMGEIGGEAVAEIDGGGGEAAATKRDALGNPRLRKEMRSKIRLCVQIGAQSAPARLAAASASLGEQI